MAQFPIPIGSAGSGQHLAQAINSYAMLQQQFTGFEVKKLRDGIGDKLIKTMGLNADSATVRDVSPLRDVAGTLFGAEDWVTSTAAVAAATVANAWFQFVNVVLANTKAVCIYGFWSRDAVPNIVRVSLRGAGGSTTYQDIDVSGIYSSLEQVAFFSTPIFYGPTNTINVQLYSRIAAISVSGLLAMVCEPQGEYLSRSIV